MQELNTCKRIGYEYFCEELFVVKSKHKYSCASAVYFNSKLNIKENCDFNYYYNQSNVTPSVLDGRHQIILANWPNYKRIIDRRIVFGQCDSKEKLDMGCIRSKLEQCPYNLK